MYDRRFWKDEVRDQNGNIIQQGTPLSSRNMNNSEEGIFAAHEFAAVVGQQIVQHKRTLEDLEGEIGQVALTNTQEYPFNNSGSTISLKKPRDTMNYRVAVEILSANGPVGEIDIYDKQLNGFKVCYTGSAKQVTIKYYVQGGMYQ